jgi:hypothetical protein
VGELDPSYLLKLWELLTSDGEGSSTLARKVCAPLSSVTVSSESGGARHGLCQGHTRGELDPASARGTHEGSCLGLWEATGEPRVPCGHMR